MRTTALIALVGVASAAPAATVTQADKQAACKTTAEWNALVKKDNDANTAAKDTMDTKKHLDLVAHNAMTASCVTAKPAESTCDADKTAYDNAKDAKHTAEDAHNKTSDIVASNTTYAANVT
jgi:hypothetical protein